MPGARAAILSRLLGALHREPLPGRERVSYPAAAAEPFAEPDAGLTAELDGVPYADPADLAAALWPASGLPAELRNSVDNLALARTAEQPDRPLGAMDLADLEQSVVDGHPLHPGARTRLGMSVADVLRYAPEHRPILHLRRLRVPAGRWLGDGPPVLLAHPWQAPRLLDEHSWLTPDGETGPMRPLMSLRTVAPARGGPHVKTAVDVRMTSAVRTVSPAAVHNGPLLSALLRHLARDLPLEILAETSAGAVLIDRQPQRRMAHLVREAPVTRPGETVLPLAALATPRLLGAAVREAGGDPYAWLADLAAVLWPPLLTVLHRGVALEAHGQNTLVALRRGRAVRILYRDLGGVRVSPARLRAAGVDPPRLHGDLPSDDPHVLPRPSVPWPPSWSPASPGTTAPTRRACGASSARPSAASRRPTPGPSWTSRCR
jgi:staphyloferrin A synthase